MESFHFTVDPDKCIRCGRCIQCCSSVILGWGADGLPHMAEWADGVAGWHGCYRCQHCLAVCPAGAVSIFGRRPEDSLTPDQAATPLQLEALMRCRRACRLLRGGGAAAGRRGVGVSPLPDQRIIMHFEEK